MGTGARVPSSGDRAPAPVYYGLAVVDVARAGGVGVGLSRRLGAVAADRRGDGADAEQPEGGRDVRQRDLAGEHTRVDRDVVVAGLERNLVAVGVHQTVVVEAARTGGSVGPPGRICRLEQPSPLRARRRGSYETCLSSPRRNFTDSARDSRVTIRVQAVTL